MTVRIFIIYLFALCVVTACKQETGTEPQKDPDPAVFNISKLSGDNQSGLPNQKLDTVYVQVLDNAGKPVANVTVDFTIMDVYGGGSVSTTNALTNTSGKAYAIWTLGSKEGVQTLQISSKTRNPGDPKFSSLPVTFTATTLSLLTLKKVISGGGTFPDGSAYLGNVTVPNPYVIVTDKNNAPIPNVTVEFTVTAGGGSSTTGSSVTNTGGVAGTNWTLGSAPGTQKMRAAIKPESNQLFRAEPVEFTLTVTRKVLLTKVGLDNQSGPFNQVLSQRLTVNGAKDESGNAMDMNYIPFNYSVITGDGKVAKWFNSASNSFAYSSISLDLTLAMGSSAVTNKVRIVAKNPDGTDASDPIIFTATASGLFTPGTTVCGGNGAGSAANQLSNPSGVFVDASGNIYIADTDNNRVQKWAPGASSGITVAGGNGKGTAANQLSGPKTIQVDNSGNLYILDQGNNRVQKWAPGASSGTTFDTGLSGSLASICLAPDGTLYFSGGTGNVMKWAPGSSHGDLVLTVSPATITGLGVNSQGEIFIGDYSYHLVKKYIPGSSGGTIVAGSERATFDSGTSSANANFSHYSLYHNAGWDDDELYAPAGIMLDKNNNVFIADQKNHRVQKWAPGASKGVTVAGGNNTGSAGNQLNLPSAVFVTSNGTIYVVDTGNNRVQKF